MIATWLMYALDAVLGAAVFSWLGLAMDRLRRRASLIHPASHCACGEPLDRVALIPVLGWVVRRGRARCCGAPVPVRYPLMEILGGALFVALLVTMGPLAVLMVTAALVVIPLVISAFRR